MPQPANEGAASKTTFKGMETSVAIAAWKELSASEGGFKLQVQRLI